MNDHSATDPIEAPVRRFTGQDGTRLAYREIGAGPAVVLFHGFLATGRQWLDYGHAGTLAEQGYRVILPELRGHGDSVPSHDPRSYPPDVLTDDGLALVEHLDLEDYALGGYSLGARIALRMLDRGARPTRAIVAGQGLAAVTRTSTGGSTRNALTALANDQPVDAGSPEAAAAQWITHFGAEPRALLNVLDSLVATPLEVLRSLRTPALVVVGDRDYEHISAHALAKTLANAQFTRVPGNHWTALTDSQLTTAISHFLTDSPGSATAQEQRLVTAADPHHLDASQSAVTRDAEHS
ncbi:alpha/beta fold hydrolase [Humibacter antri]